MTAPSQAPSNRLVRHPMRVVCLLYHDVVEDCSWNSSGFDIVGADRYKLDRKTFSRHLDAIARAIPSPPVTVAEVLRGMPVGVARLLTFDDGGMSSMLIADMLDTRGWRGHFFIPTNYIGHPAFLNRAQIRVLRGRGHVIGGHSCSHPARISACTSSHILREWSHSAAVLSDILGEPITTVSVPGGFYSEEVGAAAREAGVKVLFTSKPTSICYQNGDCLLIGRFTILRSTSPESAARIAAGSKLPMLRQSLVWRTKSFCKRVLPGGYARIRELLLSRRSR